MSKEQRTLTLGGVFDGEAKSDIEYTLGEMESVSNVDVDLTSKQVSFQYDPQVISKDIIENTLNSLGYSVRGEDR